MSQKPEVDKEVLSQMGITKYEGEWPEHSTFSFEDKNLERDKLVKKLNDETNEFIANLKPKKYEEGWKEENWKEEMDKHPFFMKKPLEEGQEIPPLVEALQQLKYDTELNPPRDIAESYKDDGNENFRWKKYQWAVDCYSKGLEAKCDDVELNVQLLTNRAAAHYHIGNYRSSLRDATAAKKLKPDHLKALQRGAHCCFKLSNFDDCIAWCNEVLTHTPDETQFKELVERSMKENEKIERAKEEVKQKEARKRREAKLLIKTVLERGIQFGDRSLEVQGMDSSVASKVHLDGNGSLVWPAIFFYPEYEQTDYIQKFHEDSCFEDHLNVMFPENNPPFWDKQRQYVAEKLQVYFNDDNNLVPVDKSSTLRSVLSHKRYKVLGGTPCFIITVANSEFDLKYKRNKCIL